MNERQLVSTNSPMESKAGYSRALAIGDTVYVSGTTGYDYSKMVMPEDITVQTRNCLATIAQSLEDAGFTMRDIVRARYYVTDRNHVDVVFAELGKVFGDIRPAATMVLCDLVDPAMKIEIEVTARKG